MDDRYNGTGINLEDLTSDEKQKFTKFESGRDYAVQAGIKHQIVREKGIPIGLTIATNGRDGFRSYQDITIYFLCCETSIGMRFGKEGMKENTITCR